MTNFSRALLRSRPRTISQRVVPANAGTHMWTAPVPQEFFEGLIGSLASICPAC
jgi:hypothetical protein